MESHDDVTHLAVPQLCTKKVIKQRLKPAKPPASHCSRLGLAWLVCFWISRCKPSRSRAEPSRDNTTQAHIKLVRLPPVYITTVSYSNSTTTRFMVCRALHSTVKCTHMHLQNDDRTPSTTPPHTHRIDWLSNLHDRILTAQVDCA